MQNSQTHPKFSLLLLKIAPLAGILHICQWESNPETNLVEVDWYFRIVASPKLQEAIKTFIDIGKVYVSLGKILLPILISGSVAIENLNPNHNRLPPQPDSIEQIDK